MAALRRRQSGLLRVLLAIVAALLAVVLVVGAVAYVRMTGTPDLGAAPRGPAHGATEQDLAIYAVRELTPLITPLSGQTHKTVLLTEQDLTAEARLRAGDALGDPQVRVRDGLVVISGRTTVLGMEVTAVGRLQVRLSTGEDGLPDIGVTIEEIDAGRLTLPALLRDAVAERIRSQVNYDSLLGADARLALLRGQMECVAVGAGGLVIGFHGPLTGADAAACTQGS